MILSLTQYKLQQLQMYGGSGTVPHMCSNKHRVDVKLQIWLGQSIPNFTPIRFETKELWAF